MKYGLRMNREPLSHPLRLRLFLNDFQPTGFVEPAANFIEATTIPGYVPRILLPEHWSFRRYAIVKSEKVSRQNGPWLEVRRGYHLFLFTDPAPGQLIRGWYLTDPRDESFALTAERFRTGPFNVMNKGDFIRLALKLDLPWEELDEETEGREEQHT